MGRVPQGYQAHFVQYESLLYLQRGAQMSEVDGVEGTAQYADQELWSPSMDIRIRF